MKGLILAAGRGTRLRPLTLRRTKPLLPLANQPLIAYALQKLLYAGIFEIGVVAGDNEAELRTGLSHIPARITYIRQPEPLGLAHAVGCARAFCGADDFVLLFCDNLFGEPLSLALAHWTALTARHPGAGALIHTIEAADPRAFGVAEVDDDGFVTGLEEKPATPKTNLAVVGIDILTPAIFDAIGRIKPSARGELEITDALFELTRLGRGVQARPLSGFWFDTGTFPDIAAALHPVMDEFGVYQAFGSYPGCELTGPVGISRHSRVAGSVLSGPVMIDGGSRVTDCRLGPYVAVGGDCRLTGCTLSDCQVYPGTRLDGVSAGGAIFDGELRVNCRIA